MPSGILLPGLKGWSLISGAQQTLDDSGVINGGPYDLTEHGAPLTYGADGVSLNGVNQFLSHDSDTSLQPGSSDYFVYAEIIPFFNVIPNIWTLMAKQNYPTDYAIEFSLFLTSWGTAYRFHSAEESIDGNLYNSAESANFTSSDLADRSVMMAWRTGDKLYIQRNTASATSTQITQDYFVSDGPFTVGYDEYNGGFAEMAIRNVRLAIGDVSAWIAAKDWLGVGRTDAEIAAYTG